MNPPIPELRWLLLCLNASAAVDVASWTLLLELKTKLLRLHSTEAEDEGAAAAWRWS
jgi:hypothetical protein